MVDNGFKDYFELYNEKLEEMFPGVNFDIETPSFHNGTTSCLGGVILDAAFSDPFLAGSESFQPYAPLLIDPWKHFQGEINKPLNLKTRSSLPQIPCGSAIISPKNSVDTFMQWVKGENPNDFTTNEVLDNSIDCVHYCEGLILLHVIDCPICLSHLYFASAYWGGNGGDRLDYFINTARFFGFMRDTWAARLYDFVVLSGDGILPIDVEMYDSIFEFMKSQDRPLFRPHLYSHLCSGHSHSQKALPPAVDTFENLVVQEVTP